VDACFVAKDMPSLENRQMAKSYVAENGNAFRKYGARFLKRGGKSEIVEGNHPTINEKIRDR
jgi:uncharacterized protein (DUF1330 family)